MIQTNIIPNAQLLEIFVFDVHPQRAQLIANAIADELIRQTPGGSEVEQEQDKFIRTQMVELQAKIEDTNNRIIELEDNLGTLTSAVDIAEAQSQLTHLQELKGEYQNNYNQFLANVSETSPNRLAVFESATEPTTPVSPNVRMNVLIAAVAGLALAISAIVLLEFFSDTLAWQPGETQSVLGVPILGVVGKVADSANKIISQDEAWSPDVDALRTLRGSIMLAAEGRPLDTLLIISAVVEEGKSFLAANLAVTIAAPSSGLAAVVTFAGSRVILVDADLRKPSLHEMFDMPNLLGLADVLAMPEAAIGAMLHKALRMTSVDNLQLLPAGRTPLDPGALINSSNFKKVLEVLKTQADLVIIDSGPLLKVVETKAIANVVDGTVLVVNNAHTRRKAVQQAIDYFKNKSNNNLLGVVFNRVKVAYGDYYTKSISQAKLRRAEQSQQPDLATLTLAEVTDYLGVSEETVRRWCEQGRIPVIKKGRYWSVRLEDLNEFIASYQQGNPFGKSQALPEVMGAIDNSSKSNGQDAFEREAL
ncbi:MAG: polysaccharide biosynthesis tyrosine autokinase [Chloroflexi bacterium]|nr:polysaccharide biosynthesis tyrosine autokinase [Chloroflexota bacterium]